ncbi:MAG: acetyltransferase-like isoleucine patch superfamily enzyme [Phycisphaerales bacterium]
MNPLPPELKKIPRSHTPCGPGDASVRPKVSIVILTLNEEINIAECLDSCAWCDDVHVVDSGSEDTTRQIAQGRGVPVAVNPFESFGKQRNWAIENLDLKHDWVFHLDADERFTPELVAEMDHVLRADPAGDGFYVPHKLIFMNRWLKRAGGYPTYQMRLFHKTRMRFIDHGHGQREKTGTRLGTLTQPYLHYMFSKGLYDWLDKHNRYSSLEALQVTRDSAGLPGPAALSVKDPVLRRRAWKDLMYHLPFRPQLRWFLTLFVLGGIFEGRAGRTYARLLSTYEQMITLKLRLLRSRAYPTAADQSRSMFETDTLPRVSTRVFSAPDRPTQAPSAQGRRDAQPIVPATLPPYEPDPHSLDGQLVPEASPWTFKEKLLRAVWMVFGKPLFRLSFHNWYGFRATLLRLFGARIGKGVHIRPTAHVEIPWNIDIRDGVTVGDYAILYSLGQITIGQRSIISQYAHLCAGTHDHTDRRFPLIRDPVTIGSDAWIGADAYVGPNVTVGDLTVLGARSSAYKDLKPTQVYVGNPAKAIKERELH